MMTAGLLALSVGLAPLAILFALGEVWTLDPGGGVHPALVDPGGGARAPGDLRAPDDAGAQLCRPIIPLLLTAVVSLFFGIVGATLLAGRPRVERRPGLLRATLLAAGERARRPARRLRRGQRRVGG